MKRLICCAAAAIVLFARPLFAQIEIPPPTAEPPPPIDIPSPEPPPPPPPPSIPTQEPPPPPPPSIPTQEPPPPPPPSIPTQEPPPPPPPPPPSPPPPSSGGGGSGQSGSGSAVETGAQPAVPTVAQDSAAPTLLPSPTAAQQRARSGGAAAPIGLTVLLCLDQDGDGRCGAADAPLGDGLITVNGVRYRTDAQGRAFVAVPAGASAVRIALAVGDQEVVRDVSVRGSTVVLAVAPRREERRDVGGSAPAAPGGAETRPAAVGAPGAREAQGALPLPLSLPSLALGGAALLAALGGAFAVLRARVRVIGGARPSRMDIERAQAAAVIPAPADLGAYLDQVCSEALREPVQRAWARTGAGWLSGDGELFVSWLDRRAVGKMMPIATEASLDATPSEPLCAERLSLLWDGERTRRPWRVYRRRAAGDLLARVTRR